MPSGRTPQGLLLLSVAKHGDGKAIDELINRGFGEVRRPEKPVGASGLLQALLGRAVELGEPRLEQRSETLRLVRMNTLSRDVVVVMETTVRCSCSTPWRVGNSSVRLSPGSRRRHWSAACSRSSGARRHSACSPRTHLRGSLSDGFSGRGHHERILPPWSSGHCGTHIVLTRQPARSLSRASEFSSPIQVDRDQQDGEEE